MALGIRGERKKALARYQDVELGGSVWVERYMGGWSCNVEAFCCVEYSD